MTTDPVTTDPILRRGSIGRRTLEPGTVGNSVQTPMWYVQYTDPQEPKFHEKWHPWCRVQTWEEAVWQAYRREQAGWLARIITPDILEVLKSMAGAS